MIMIDLEKGVNGSIGGNIETILREYSTITAYVYKLYITESPKNKKLFDELIKDSKKMAKEIEDFKDKRKTVVKEEPTVLSKEEIDKHMSYVNSLVNKKS